MAKLRVRVAKALHESMIKKIMRAPISFFDVTPAGRIMNRFSKEINSVDTTTKQHGHSKSSDRCRGAGNPNIQ